MALGAGLAPLAKLLNEALAAAFQASLTSEEGDRPAFGLLLTPVERLSPDGVPNEGVLRLRFDHSRSLNADELRRLSPSVAFETSLIGAHPEEGKLRIWGVAHSGPAWLAPTWGGRSLVPNWTYDPIIHVTGPGRLAVRCAGKLVGALERGVVVDAMIDVFDSEWLPDLFAREREEILRRARRTCKRGPLHRRWPSTRWWGAWASSMLRRAIQLVRGAAHGGMILVVDAPGRDADASMACGSSIASQKTSRRTAIERCSFGFCERVAAATLEGLGGLGGLRPGCERRTRTTRAERVRAESLIANLSAIDGAVIVDKRFCLVGFGAEVSAELPRRRRSMRARRHEGEQRVPEDIENVGTRHRAAYRFIKAHPGALAIVISQDGGVTVVASRDGDVVFWEQSVGP